MRVGKSLNERTAAQKANARDSRVEAALAELDHARQHHPTPGDEVDRRLAWARDQLAALLADLRAIATKEGRR